MKRFYLLLGIFCFILCSCDTKEEKLNLKPKIKREKQVTGYVGTGWSQKKEGKSATREALTMALKTTKGKVRFAMFFASSGSDLKAIAYEMKKKLGPQVKIFGMTSDSRAVMCDKKYVRAEKRAYKITAGGHRALVIMTCSSSKIEVGLGYANFSNKNSIEKNAENAIRNAIKDAGRKPHQKPKAIIVGIWNTNWHKIQNALDSIQKVIGKDTLLIGQCPGGPQSVMICNENIVKPNGIILAAIYTDLPIGLSCKAGFETKNLASGLVTKASENTIYEIDHKNGLQVYKNWLKKSNIKNLDQDSFVLQPLYRKYTSKSHHSFYLFSHPMPTKKEIGGKATPVLNTGTEIKKGEKVYLSQGNWQTLLNRIGNAPAKAKHEAGISTQEKPMLSILFVCTGVMGTIPKFDRDHMPILINKANAKAPFIASFAWGEQMHYPEIGYKHGNLHVSCLVIGREKKKSK